MYDLIIIGGGPAGVAAAVYAARKHLKTGLIAEEIGGQSTVSEGIENWIGSPKIHGQELAKLFKAHLEAVKGDMVELALGERVVKLEKSSEGFIVTMVKAGRAPGGTSTSASGRSVLVVSGAGRRKLDVPGAEKFENKGVTYCASCDGPLFSGMDVAVVGGGNAGFESAAQLLAYCKSVTLLNRSDTFRADEITLEKVLKNPKMRAIKNVEVIEVKGDKFVEGLVYKDANGEEHELKASGIFVEIGQLPNTNFVKGLVELDPVGRVKIDPITGKTNVPGIWAAGDCTDVLYHQNNIAAGDAVRALEDIYVTLHTK